MNAADILKLVNAGYTKADIEALTAEAAPEAKPAEAPEVKPAEAPEVKPAETAPEVKPEDKAPLDPEIAKTLALMNETLGKLQAFAVKTDGNADIKTNDYKDILGGIINGRKE